MAAVELSRLVKVTWRGIDGYLGKPVGQDGPRIEIKRVVAARDKSVRP